MSNNILFVSTNSIWGGSEILWSQTAALLSEKGYAVTFAVRYNHSIIQKLQKNGAAFISLNSIDKPGIVGRILRKARIKPHPFLAAITRAKPQFVVISQGNNIDGEYYMTVCRQKGIPYVTITQLVTDMLLTFIKDKTLDTLRACYASAQVNYFVSQSNLQMHQIMIGEKHANSKIVLNPFTVPVDVPKEYPPVVDGTYHIALVGRLETFHKGHDLLIQVLQSQKWKSRKVNFNFYGSGPHQLLLQRLVKMHNITNIAFKGHVNNVAEVWKHNHLLILPSRMEGQSLALIEAMWCYRGAVVTDVGGAKELITHGENGFLAAQPTVKDIDQTLEQAWSQREQWESIGIRAGEKVRAVYINNPIITFAQEIESEFSKAVTI